MIADSLAIGFYSNISLRLDPYGLSNQIVPIYIKEEEQIYSTYGIVTKKKPYQSIIAQKFVEELKLQAELYKKLHNLPDYS